MMKVAILGAGVGGVASAIALRQRGFDVRIYERHPRASVIGAGIVVWPNAAYVLERLGVLHEIEAIAGRPRAMRRISRDGEALGGIDIDSINRIMGYPSLSVLRWQFQETLIRHLSGLGVEIQYGHSVTAIRESEMGHAEVVLNQQDRITADVIIGADGRMASLAREYVHGDNRPVYQGFINWIGVYHSGRAEFDRIEVSDFWGVGERFGIVPINADTAYWAGGIAAEAIGPRDPLLYHQELLECFADWPEPIARIIRDTPVERINKIYVHDHDPIPVWHRGNVVAIGDAAHAALPTSGQGACQALEDAWHLAELLTEKALPLQQVFERFTRERLAKTSGIIMAGRGLASSLFNVDAEYCRERNENSKRSDYRKLAEGMARGWSQGLPLGA